MLASVVVLREMEKWGETQLPNDLGVVFLQGGEVFLFFSYSLCFSFVLREMKNGEKPNSQLIWDLGVVFLEAG